MALESEVAALTTAVNGVTSAVQLDTSTRQASVTAAQNAAVAAQNAVATAGDTAAAAAAATLATAVNGYIATATAQADRASTAADAAAVSGQLYATVAAGEAATTNGQTFKVVSTADTDAIDIRTRTASASTLLKTLPSSGRVVTIGNVVGPSIISFGPAGATGKALLHDYNGIYGLPRVLYVPRDVTIQTIGGGANTLTGLGTDSTRIPGYYEIVLPNSTNPYKLFLNRTTGEITFVARAVLPALSDNLLPLFEIVGNAICNTRVLVEKTEAGNGQVHFYDPPVEELGHLMLVPRYQWTNGTFTVDRPVPVSQWGRPLMFDKEISLATSGTSQTLNIDAIAASKGLDPLVVASYPRQPSGLTTVRIASGKQAAAPLAHHTGHPIIGVPSSVRNIANLGQNNPELATIKSGTVAYTDFTSPELIALGYTKAVTSSAKVSAFYGIPLDDIRVGDTRFVRFAVELDYDTTADIDIPAFLASYLDKDGLPRHAVALKIERQLSARALILALQHVLPANTTYTGWKGMQVGCASFGGKDIKFGGLQIGATSRRSTWVMRADFPAPVNSAGVPIDPNYDFPTISKLAGKATGVPLIYPKEMFLVEGQPQTLYADGLFETRTNNQDPFISVQPRRGTLITNSKPLPKTSKHSIELIGGNVPPLADILVRAVTEDIPQTRGVVQIDVRTALLSQLSGLTTNLLFTGDSVTEWTGYPHATIRELARLGVTAKTIGSSRHYERDQTTGSPNYIPGEGRGGADSANYTYAQGENSAQSCSPFPNSFIGSYLALTEIQKRDWNPFIRPAVGSDPAEYVINGYIVDFEFWRTRFNTYYIANGQPEKVMPVPKFNFFNIGTNDEIVQRFGPSGVAPGGLPARSSYVAQAYDTWIARSLAAWPNTYVCLLTNPLGRHELGMTKYPGHIILSRLQQAAVAKYSAQKDAFGRNRVSWLSGLAHGTSEFGYEMDYGAVDPITGFAASTLKDPVHLEGVPREQLGILCAHYVACRLTGA